MSLADVAPVTGVGVLIVAFLWIDLHFFARGREPGFREAIGWSLGWLVVSLAAALVIWALRGEDDAVLYTSVYLVERSLSLDNLFVFLMLFVYFKVPVSERGYLIFWGIVLAIAMRGVAILGGVALVEQFHFLIYILGATLLVLAYRVFRSDELEAEGGDNAMVRLVRMVFPVTERYHGRRWFLRIDRKTYATPLFLALSAVVFSDILFAIDSIPAAFGITRDPFLIWIGNVFALLGLRALFVLVDGLNRRFRYLDETIAIVLGVVALKLLLEDVYKVSPEASLAAIATLLAAGIGLSMLADRRDAARMRRTEAKEAAG